MNIELIVFGLLCVLLLIIVLAMAIVLNSTNSKGGYQPVNKTKRKVLNSPKPADGFTQDEVKSVVKR